MRWPPRRRRRCRSTRPPPGWRGCAAAGLARRRRSRSRVCSGGRSLWSAARGAAAPLRSRHRPRRLSPIPLTLAARIAEADHAGDLRAARVTRIAANDSEYRGALPAWRVDFEDGEGRSIYVAADTGAVTARRSTLWRAYDFLWGLHIMDWRGHENFNTWLLVVATAAGAGHEHRRHRPAAEPARPHRLAQAAAGRAGSMLREHPPLPRPGEQDRPIGLAMAAMLHAGRAHRHAGDGDAGGGGPLAQQAADVGGRDMALDRIAADRGGVAGAQIVRHAEPPRGRRDVGDVGDPHLEAGAAQMRDPGVAAAAARRFHHRDERARPGAASA